ncbi:cytochrome C oxidase subunit II, transmembrane region [Calothrix sp. NIES-4101]|nr:cytochrome C oxidase subunit II, transmembrane region [Calothrix sp. NIES-4101]
MKIPSSIWTLLIGILLTLVSLWYGQNHGLLPIAASNEAVLIDGLFNTMMTVSIGIFLLVEGILIYSAFKYRRRPGDDSDGPPVHGNVPLEILWTAIPAIIVIGISVYSFEIYNDIGGFSLHGGHDAPITLSTVKNKPGSAIAATLTETANPNEDHAHMGMPQQTTTQTVAQSDDAGINASPENANKPADLLVNVMGIQYAFIFSYPETGVSSGELHVPIGREVQLNMSGSDVIHAFWVPEFRLKQDVIPGRETTVRFTPKTEGDYALICAELCGPYHGAMRTHVIVEPQQAFDQWMQEQLVANAGNLDQAVAMNPANSSVSEFLAPYTQEMGIKPEVLHQVHQ